MADSRDLLEQATATLQLSLNDQAVDDLLTYVALLQKWNRVYNLTAIRDERAILSHHLFDCLAVVRPVLEKLGLPDVADASQSRLASVLDVGAGAGLPGLVLAVCAPQLSVCCIDAVQKKTAFVRQAISHLKLENLHVIHGRVENLHLGQPKTRFDLITARAFSSLAQLVTMTQPLLADGGCWMAMKAKQVDSEIAELPRDVKVFHVEPITVPTLTAERCLIWMHPATANLAFGSPFSQTPVTVQPT